MSYLKTRFADPQTGVYFVGTTPPRRNTPDEQVEEIAGKLLERLSGLQYDGLIVYDIQDESSRIDTPRPFPFSSTHDPREYSCLLRRLSGHNVITYKSVSQRDAVDFNRWLDEAHADFGVEDLVLVGSPSANGEIHLSLDQAYALLGEHAAGFNLGGVTIAERHARKGNEHQRLLDKQAHGCHFFVSQAVYHAQATIDLLTRYAMACKEQGIEPRRIILTFTPCGSLKTLEFMEWLGISVPEATRLRMMAAENPLRESIRICRNNLEQILEACVPLGIPLGLNIESLTNRKEEIDGAIRLFRLLKALMDLRLAERDL